MNNLNDKSRYAFIDVLRGFTIILMFIFHTTFDFNYFGFVHVDIIRDPIWYYLPRLIVFLFFFAVGMSLVIVHGKKIHWSIFWKRFFKLAFFAVTISIVTYIMFPQNWIYFGTLHSIAIISLMSLPFLKYPKIALLLALSLFIPSMIWDKNIPWIELPLESWDYISPFPWVGASLLGIYSLTKNLHLVKIPSNVIFKNLQFLGKHSLLIYLIHQPFLFGMSFLIFKIKS